MLQTNAAGAMLSGSGIDKPPTKAGKSTDGSGGFSQEFEKQVKRTSDSSPETEASKTREQQETSANNSEGAEQKTAKEADKASAHKDDTGENSQRSDAEEDKALARKDGAGENSQRSDAEAEKAAGKEGGKTLPQQLAAETDPKASSGVQSEQELKVRTTTESESGDGQIVEAETNKLPLSVGEGPGNKDAIFLKQVNPEAEDATPVGMAQLFRATDTNKASSESREIRLEGEAVSSNARLRDVLAQRMLANSGGEGGDIGAGRQGKGDLTGMLAAQVGQSRTAGGFEHMLNGAAPISATGSPVPGVAQPAAASVPAAMTLAVPVQQQGWGEAMGERVMWMARSNIQQAQIQLNPRDLGPIEIKVSMQNDQTHVNFVAHHATTRDALEAAIPRLRDMFNEQGLNLGQTDVSQHSFGDGGNQPDGAEDGGAQGTHTAAGEQGATDDGSDSTLMRHVSHVGPSGVDYFA